MGSKASIVVNCSCIRILRRKYTKDKNKHLSRSIFKLRKISNFKIMTTTYWVIALVLVVIVAWLMMSKKKKGPEAPKGPQTPPAAM